jgi:hypothetical protein
MKQNRLLDKTFMLTLAQYNKTKDDRITDNG